MKSIVVVVSVLLLSACSAVKPEKAKAPEVLQSAHTLASGGVLKDDQAAVKITHADLAFTVYPKKQAIAGVAKLTLEGQRNATQVALDLDKVFTIHTIQVDGVTLDKSRYANDEGLLTIVFDQPVKAGQSIELSVDYSGQPLVAKNPPWKGGIVWEETDSGQPWIATAVQTEGCDLFWPCIDHPQREPAALDMHITVPAPLVAAANGKLISVKKEEQWHTYHWRSNNSVNTYAVSLNIGPFELLEDTYKSRYGNEIELQFWHLAGNKEKAQKLFDEFPRILDFFETMIGPYPFSDEKMGVVETPHLGMEHQTINAYGNKYRVGPYGFDWLLHHEFAHEWFGNQLTHDTQDDLWLHEGFGTYMQPLYAQYLHGDMAYHSYLYRNRQGINSNAPMVQGKSRGEVDLASDGSGANAYYKGALVLHTLRQFIGDEAFFAATRALVYGTDNPQPGNFKPLNSSTETFIEQVNRKTGQDLTWLFKAYLYQAKLPELVIERSQDKVAFRWQLENDLPFPMPLEVKVDGKLVVLDMKDNRGEVAIKPFSVVQPDPASKILKQEQHIENWRKAGPKNRDR